MLRSRLFGLGLISCAIWSACRAPDPDVLPDATGGAGDSSELGGASAGARAGGGARAANGGASNVSSSGADVGGEADGGAAAAAAGLTDAGSGGAACAAIDCGGSTPDCAADSPIKAGCACASPQDLPACRALAAGIAHRYSFDGTGTALTDSVAPGAAGTAVSTSLTGSGELTFNSGDQYADLPNGLISSLTSATLEAWVTWQGADKWQRIFDFGDTVMGPEGQPGFGRSYLFLSPKGTGDFVRAVFKSPTGMEVLVDSTPALTSGQLSHIAVTFDGVQSLMSLYVNGVFGGSTPVTDHLADIHDINDWLGRSQYLEDPGYLGSIQEFRIYSVALTAAQIALSRAQGPDTALFSPAQ